jgi:hypothetical protein
MKKEEIRDAIEQMDNTNVDIDSISLVGVAISYVYNQTSRDCDFGWKDGIKTTGQIEHYIKRN